VRGSGFGVQALTRLVRARLDEGVDEELSVCVPSVPVRFGPVALGAVSTLEPAQMAPQPAICRLSVQAAA